MGTTHGLAAILRDARKGALLRMRSETGYPAGAVIGLAEGETRWRGMTENRNYPPY
jgi:hypothetical protein